MEEEIKICEECGYTTHIKYSDGVEIEGTCLCKPDLEKEQYDKTATDRVVKDEYGTKL